MTRLAPNHFEEALALRHPDYLANMQDVYAWKVVFDQPDSGRMQSSERFYATFEAAEAVANEAMLRQKPEDARIFGRLVAYPERVRTSIYTKVHQS